MPALWFPALGHLSSPTDRAIDPDPTLLIPNNNAIIEYCGSDDRSILCACQRTEIVALMPGVVVKFGHIFSEEAQNQDFAYRHLDQDIVRFPKVFRYFEHDEHGYLVMEFMQGLQRVVVEDAEDVAWAVEHIHSLSSRGPGPVGGGFSRERFDEDQILVQDLCWIMMIWSSVTLALLRAMSGDGTLCFLDWAFSGFYPRWLEIAVLESCDDADPTSGEFKTAVIQALADLAPLTDTEEQQLYSAANVILNCMSSHFPRWNALLASPAEKSWKQRRERLDAKLDSEISTSSLEADGSMKYPIYSQPADMNSLPHNKFESPTSGMDDIFEGSVEHPTLHSNDPSLVSGIGAPLIDDKGNTRTVKALSSTGTDISSASSMNILRPRHLYTLFDSSRSSSPLSSLSSWYNVDASIPLEDCAKVGELPVLDTAPALVPKSPFPEPDQENTPPTWASLGLPSPSFINGLPPQEFRLPWITSVNHALPITPSVESGQKNMLR
ncbi:hypothetical protein K461DRAFT_320406 [Myriangium duriaei CBS 260.36]|uniref:Aminoglycoside phosphotransferase domain-containing protein n=1 Tax=Myriangium duriaei CBS 260.36 TaxID=1168546 RepID=A0A9P4J2G8_9PEZI|nr:hypothetical protein K461DRAFT_320406 [Myriangium duriaei CBS 260.36]